MSRQHVPVTGGCLCGAVRYEAKEPPLQGFYCHCRICQRNYGSLFPATLKFLGSSFRITRGDLKYYRSTIFAKRGFCAECGSPIVFSYEGNPNTWILIGSLDHPEDWPLTKDASWGPSGHWYFEAKVPWYDINDGLPHFSEAPAAIAAQHHVASLRSDPNV
jgi:hypothetical protein